MGEDEAQMHTTCLASVRPWISPPHHHQKLKKEKRNFKEMSFLCAFLIKTLEWVAPCRTKFRYEYWSVKYCLHCKFPPDCSGAVLCVPLAAFPLRKPVCLHLWCLNPREVGRGPEAGVSVCDTELHKAWFRGRAQLNSVKEGKVPRAFAVLLQSTGQFKYSLLPQLVQN